MNNSEPCGDSCYILLPLSSSQTKIFCNLSFFVKNHKIIIHNICKIHIFTFTCFYSLHILLLNRYIYKEMLVEASNVLRQKRAKFGDNRANFENKCFLVLIQFMSPIKCLWANQNFSSKIFLKKLIIRSINRNSEIKSPIFVAFWPRRSRGLQLFSCGK